MSRENFDTPHTSKRKRQRTIIMRQTDKCRDNVVQLRKIQKRKNDTFIRSSLLDKSLVYLVFI